MIEAIVAGMGSSFCQGVFTEKTSFRFELEEISITVIIDAQCYAAEMDSALVTVDCCCNTSSEMFRQIWFDGYRPGIMDFLGGAIRCDAPLLLPQFLKAFGR